MNNPVPNLHCPTCGSEHTQKLSLAVHAGTTTSQTVTGVMGMGNGHLGNGLALSGGTSTTALAKQYAEPRKRPVFLPVLLALPAAGFLAIFDGAYGAALLAPFVIWGMINFSFNRDEQPQLHEAWSRKFICLRCGEVFVPK